MFSNRSPRSSYSRRVRTVGVAVLVAAAVVCGGFTLQTVGLPDPARADVAAARASELLLGYRYVTSTLHIRGRTLHGRCFHGWFGGLAEHRERGTLLLLGNGASIRALARHATPLVRGLPPRLSPLRVLTLAGCTEELGPRLANVATTGDVHAHHVELHERLVLALDYAHTQVLVSPHDDLPLGVRVAGMTSTIRLMRLYPSTLRALEASP
jgi:hypothetical protein